MKKIIVLFKQNAESLNALFYALETADFLSVGIELILVGKDLNSPVDENCRVLNDFVLNPGRFEYSPSFQEMKINMIPHSSFYKKLKQKSNIVAVIAGIENENDSEFYYSELTEELHHPLLLIPRAMKFCAPSKMVIVSKFERLDIDLIERYRRLGKLFDSEIRFMFSLPNLNDLGTQEEIFRKLFLGGVPEFSFEMSFFSEKSMEVELGKFLAKNKSDFIVINPEQMPRLTPDFSLVSDLPTVVDFNFPIFLLGKETREIQVKV